MAKFKPQQRRHLWIDQELKLRRTRGSVNIPTAKTLAAKYSEEYPEWKVSSRTVRRDIEYMRDEQGYPIERTPEGGYYYTEEHHPLTAIEIKDSELFFTCVAERALKQYRNTPLYEKLKSLFDRIQSCLPSKVTVDPAWMNDVRISFMDTPARKNDVAIWEEISKALYQERRLNIIYQKVRQRVGKARTLDPYHLIGCDGAWYLLAHDRTDGQKKGVKLFAVNRITRARKLTTKAEIPENLNLKKYVGTFGVMREKQKYDMKIKFNANCAPYVKERQWYENQKIEDGPAGSIIFSSKGETTHMDQVARWVISWGSGAKVMTPKALADIVKAELKAAVKQYSGK